MATPTITLDEVRAAIAALRERGLEPSVRRIRGALGNRGSNEVILRMRRQILGLPENAEPAEPPPNLLLRMQDLAPELWKSAQEEARRSLAGEIERLSAAAAAARGEADELAAQLTEAQQQAAMERAERERLAGEVAAAGAAIVAQQQALQEHGAALGRHGDAVADLRTAVGVSGDALRSLLAELDERWRREITARDTLLAEARAQAAAAAAENVALRSAIAEAQTQVGSLSAALGAARAELAGVQTQAAERGAQVAALRRELAEAQAQVRDAREAEDRAVQLAQTMESRAGDLVLRQQADAARLADGVRRLAEAETAAAQASEERDRLAATVDRLSAALESQSGLADRLDAMGQALERIAQTRPGREE